MHLLVLQWLEKQHISLPTLITLTISLIFLLIFLSSKSSKNHLVPPSPTGLPIIGNLHQLGTLPHRNLQSLSRKYGPIMLIHLGQCPTLIVSSADAARDIMKTHDLVFSNRPHARFPTRLFFGKDIAFAPYSEYWRQTRKLCVLQLLSAYKVLSYRNVREEETEVLVDKINRFCSSLEKKFDLSQLMISFTNDIICRVALGRKYFEGEDEHRIKETMKEFSYLIGVFNVGDFLPRLSWINYFNGLEKRVERNRKDLDSFLEGVIEEHVEKKIRKIGSGGDDGDGGGIGSGEDFVDILLGVKESTIGVPFTRENIKAIVMDMFAAGTDTSFTLLEWTMAELIRHPHIMKEVQEEIRGIMKSKARVKESDLHKMTQLQLVIKEMLRLHPPVPLLVPRESLEDVQIQGYHIPAKTRVIINDWAIGRDPVSWEEPEVFRPKRFLNRTTDYKGHDFELIPFGAGRRGCPGILFATTIVELVLANLLHRFDWSLPEGLSGEKLDMSEVFGISVHLKAPLFIVATPHLIKN